MIIKQLLLIFVVAVVALILYNIVKPYIFFNLKPNKTVVFILLLVFFILPVFISPLINNIVFMVIYFLAITILALTYFDLIREARAEKNKPIVGKPKAKPNRIKSKNE